MYFWQIPCQGIIRIIEYLHEAEAGKDGGPIFRICPDAADTDGSCRRSGGFGAASLAGSGTETGAGAETHEQPDSMDFHTTQAGNRQPPLGRGDE